MSRENTLFIVGAGASNEVGMPTGKELKERLLELLDVKTVDNRTYTSDPIVLEALLALNPAAAFSSGGPVEIASQVRRGLVLARSVDNLLEAHKKNKLAVQIGKIAIVKAILDAEKSSALGPDDSGKRFSMLKVANTWYAKFFQFIIDGNSFERLPKKLESINVVTFNYDRTLEHFLLWAICDYYTVSPDEAMKVLLNLNIVHPYGIVGNLPWQGNGNLIAFGGEFSSSELIELSKNVVTFSEGSKVRPTIDWETTRKVFFLGFAFHKINMQYLFPNEITPQAQGPFNPIDLHGTSLGVSKKNTEKIGERLKAVFGPGSKVSFYGGGCSRFMDDYWNVM